MPLGGGLIPHSYPPSQVHSIQDTCTCYPQTQTQVFPKTTTLCQDTFICHPLLQQNVLHPFSGPGRLANTLGWAHFPDEETEVHKPVEGPRYTLAVPPTTTQLVAHRPDGAGRWHSVRG